MKHFKSILLIAILLASTTFAQSPTISIIDSGRNVSIRGLSVVNDKVIWCSGSNGSVARSVNRGKNFEWVTVMGYEKRDFRDIEAFDANTAIIMAIAEPAIILKTKDGGKTWQKVFEDSAKGMFLDAMDFDKKGNGAVVGDPIKSHLFMACTLDFGDTWIRYKEKNLCAKGEAFFASSGTNISYPAKRKQHIVKVSGGISSRFYWGILGSNNILNMASGKESTGANSVDRLKKKVVIVGGDFANDKSRDSNCVLVNLKRRVEFSSPQTQPYGYRSCVIFYNKKTLVCCGTSGVDISTDGGKNWKNISTQGFHVVQKAKKGKAIFLAGGKGKIAKLAL
jgi:photosystem II stability/assembly factor-like uncharacterized protein